MLNVHERRIAASPDEVGALLADAGGPQDRTWPTAAWMPMRLGRPVAVGADGGHADIRYAVTAYEPGRLLEFTFHPPTQLVGVHRFEVERRERVGTVLRHTLEVDVRGRLRLAWLLGLRSLHGALLEDLLDRAELAVEGRVHAPARWSPYVRVARWAGRGRAGHARGA